MTPIFLDANFATIRRQARQLLLPVYPVLLHSSVLPGKLLYRETGPWPVDWDQRRASWWWADEVLRALYYFPTAELLNCCLRHYDCEVYTLDEMRTSARLEHVRQAQRSTCVSTFNVPACVRARAALRRYTATIRARLH